MFTSHGHQIPGTINEPRPEGMQVTPCGAMGLCSRCSREAIVEQGKLPKTRDDILYVDGMRCVGWIVIGGPNAGEIYRDASHIDLACEFDSIQRVYTKE